MSFISDSILDAALQKLIDDGDRLDICSQEPTTYTEATSTFTLGNKTAISIGAQQNGDVSGRKSTIAEITDGSVTDSGTATHIGVSDTTGTELMVTEALSASQAVTDGNIFTLTAFDVEFPDPA